MQPINDNEPSTDPDSLFRRGRLALGGLKRQFLPAELDWIAEQIAYALAAVIARHAVGKQHSLIREIALLMKTRPGLDHSSVEFAVVELRLVSLHLVGLRNSTCREVRRDARDLLHSIGSFIEGHATENALIALRSGVANEYLGLTRND